MKLLLTPLTLALVVSLHYSDAFMPSLNKIKAASHIATQTQGKCFSTTSGRGTGTETETGSIYTTFDHGLDVDADANKDKDEDESARTLVGTATCTNEFFQKESTKKPMMITTNTKTVTTTTSTTVSTYSIGTTSTSSTFTNLDQHQKNIGIAIDTGVYADTDASVDAGVSIDADASVDADADTDSGSTQTLSYQFKNTHMIDNYNNDNIKNKEMIIVLPNNDDNKEEEVIEEETIFSEKKLLEQLLEHQAFTKGETHIDTMKTLHNLATYMYQNGADGDEYPYDKNDQEEAKTLYHICYEQQKMALGTSHPDTILTLNNLVTLYHGEGDYDSAKELLLSYVDENDTDLDLKTLDMLLQLAFAYHREKMIVDAMDLYESYLCHFHLDNDNDTDNNDTDDNDNYNQHYNHFLQNKLSAQHNLGVLYQNQGKFNKSKPYIEECYHTRKELLGDTHPLTLGTMNNLAALYHKIGEYDNAMSMYEDCLELKMDCLGDEHPDTLLTFRNLERLREVYSSFE